MDALEFVQSLEGGWDCIIYDPPYLNDDRSHRKDYWTSRTNKIAWNIPTREVTSINEDYLIKFNELINNKITTPFIFIEFSNLIKDSDALFIWDKTPHRLRIGNNILNNAEFINVYFKNDYHLKQGNPYKHLEKILHYYNGLTNKTKYTKPIKLLKDLLLWSQCNYILDPFAGSYNSVKAANQLNIKIDACDKYQKIPKNLDSTLNNWIK